MNWPTTDNDSDWHVLNTLTELMVSICKGLFMQPFSFLPFLKCCPEIVITTDWRSSKGSLHSSTFAKLWCVTCQLSPEPSPKKVAEWRCKLTKVLSRHEHFLFYNWKASLCKYKHCFPYRKSARLGEVLYVPVLVTKYQMMVIDDDRWFFSLFSNVLMSVSQL